MLYALCGFMLVGLWGHLLAWLHPTTCETYLCDVGVPDTHLPLLRAMLLCLPSLLCSTRLTFFSSLHLCMLAYMFMHESVSSTLQSNGTMDTRSKPTFVLLGHPFCLITCLFAPVWLSFFGSFSFNMLSLCLFLCFSAGLFLLLLHVHTWSMDTWSKGVTSLAQAKYGKDASKKTQAHKGQCSIDWGA